MRNAPVASEIFGSVPSRSDDSSHFLSGGISGAESVAEEPMFIRRPRTNHRLEAMMRSLPRVDVDRRLDPNHGLVEAAGWLLFALLLVGCVYSAVAGRI